MTLDRSPSTSVQGSVWLTWIMTTPPAKVISTRPLLLPASSRRSTSSSTRRDGRDVVLAGLEDRAGGGDVVAAALDLERVEEGAVRDVVVRVQLGPDEVAGLEVDDAVGPGADRAEIGWRLA